MPNGIKKLKTFFLSDFKKPSLHQKNDLYFFTDIKKRFNDVYE